MTWIKQQYIRGIWRFVEYGKPKAKNHLIMDIHN